MNFCADLGGNNLSASQMGKRIICILFQTTSSMENDLIDVWPLSHDQCLCGQYFSIEAVQLCI